MPNETTDPRETPLAARNVSVQFGDARALDAVSADFRKGEATGVLGPNGAGKTTLLRVLTGEQKRAGGEVLLDGAPIESYSKREKALRMGVMAQLTEGVGELTPREIVSMGRFARRPIHASMRRADIEAVDAALEAARLTDLQDRPSKLLSGGERQRVFLAQLWAQEPTVALLDEPTAHLDVKYQGETMRAARAMAKRRNWTVVIAVHDLNLAYRYCDRLLFLRGGKTVAFGTAEALRDPSVIRETFGVEAAFLEADGAPQVALSI